MAQGVYFLSGGKRSIVNIPIESCTDFVVLAASEYTDIPTMQNIFTIPLVEDMQQMWMLGFSLPMITYLVAWGYQTVINFASKDDDK